MRRTVVWLILLVACSSKPPLASSGDAGDSMDAAGTPGDAGPVDAAPPGDPFAALVALPGMCSVDGWCWRWPTPHGNNYVRVFSTAPDNIWLTAWGTVMQWNGRAWTFHHPPVLAGQGPAQFPMSIGGSSATNMWLVYGTTLQQWDGATWTIRDSLPVSGNPNYNNVWVAPDTGEAFATISNGQLKRWHDGALEIDSPCSCFLGSIWGTSSQDVFITTLGLGILHFDGRQFTQSYAGSVIMGAYSGVRDDVWVGGSGQLMHWDGTGWTPVAMPPEIANLNAWVNTAGWLASDDVWWYVFAGSRKGFLHWDGASLSFVEQDPADDGANPQFNSVAIIDGRWWMVGTGGAVYTRTGPSAATSIVHPQTGLTWLWGAADNDMYGYVNAELQHWDGQTMTPMAIPTVGTVAPGIDPVFNFVAEQGASFGPIFSMHPGEAMLVGVGPDATGVFHYMNGAWSPVTTKATSQLTGVWGPDPDHLWVTGLHGTILQWDRAAPGVMTADPGLATTQDLGPIHGVDGTTWIASPGTSTMWRNDGSGWTELAAPSVSAWWGGLLVISPTNIVTSSTGSTDTRRWDGAAWLPEDNASTYGMYRLFRPPGGSTFAGSYVNGMVSHP